MTFVLEIIGGMFIAVVVLFAIYARIGAMSSGNGSKGETK